MLRALLEAVRQEEELVVRFCTTLIVLSLGSATFAAVPVGFPQSHVATQLPRSVAASFVREQTEEPSEITDRFLDQGTAPRRLPPVVPAAFVEYETEDGDACEDCSCFNVDYDGGILVEACDEQGRLFDMKVNGRIQFRYAGFGRDVATYTDNAGVTTPVRNRSRFDIERARLILSGHVFDKNWKYFLQLDGNTDRGSQVVFFDYWWAYHFGDLLELRVGKAKVPGTRQWLLPAFRTRLVDRPMATGFFRPGRTQGIWADGKLGESVRYEAMIGNGYRTSNLTPQQVNNKFAIAGSLYQDLLGDYGVHVIDFANHDQAVTRMGSSFVFARQSGISNTGTPLQESAFARLSDGTVLTSTGALAPGVTINAYDLLLVSLDVAAKYRGWSFDAEYYLRWIDAMQASGALPVNELYQHGFYVEGGHFIVPQTLDFNVRYSQVRGVFGTSTEYAAGFNYFPHQSLNVKMSFDVTWLDGAPTSITSSDIVVGDDGTLFRAQLQAYF